ncbi:hypothetical protein PHK61_17640 [Actinomycetospora lutea]|uniref:hypothetical protein n=1 Tax=Actinomycetospora lutea TaxID=663604 RepID=UPI0023670803|nr:hypothetical protein [Actinomycetospora lutea]MDD7940250.1 hypothetical protein [Actinomycetospora lutea]
MTAATRPGSESPSGQPPELGPAIRAALEHLADLTQPPPAVIDGRLDQMLRAAVVAHGARAGRGGATEGHRLAMAEVAVAVRTACAHLAARELEDAYLALRAAADRLPRIVR